MSVAFKVNAVIFRLYTDGSAKRQCHMLYGDRVLVAQSSPIVCCPPFIIIVHMLHLLAIIWGSIACQYRRSGLIKNGSD